jgi:hypothetical protein
MALSGDMVFRPKKDITWRETEGKLIVLNLQSGLYYTLDEMATVFFKLLIQEKKVADVVSEICKEYKATQEQILADLEEFIGTLSQENILEPVNA